MSALDPDDLPPEPDRASLDDVAARIAAADPHPTAAARGELRRALLAYAAAHPPGPHRPARLYWRVAAFVGGGTALMAVAAPPGCTDDAPAACDRQAGNAPVGTTHVRPRAARAYELSSNSLWERVQSHRGKDRVEMKKALPALAAAVATLALASTASAATAPTAVTEAATNVTKTGATVNGTVNPNGSETLFVFEYGTTTPYDHLSRVGVLPGGLEPPYSTAEAVSAHLTRLQRNTTYHYRLVALNGVGLSLGDDMTFTTGQLTTPPPAEKISNLSVTPNRVRPRGTITISYDLSEAGSSTITIHRGSTDKGPTVGVLGPTDNGASPPPVSVQTSAPRRRGPYTVVVTVIPTNGGASDTQSTSFRVGR